jgi:hypothetical protein
MNMSNRNIDGKTFAIGVLSVTATVLFTAFLLLVSNPQPAHATGQNDRSGDYIMLTQQLTDSTEGIVITDAAANRMILYVYDYNAKKLKQLDGYELDKLPKPREREQPRNPRPGGR